MKKILFVLGLLSFGNTIHGQFDSQFYFPSKTMEPIDDSISITQFKYKIEADTLSVLVLNPSQKAMCNVLYFHGTGGNNTNYIPFVKPFLEVNYRVFMIDFRGYGLSTGTPTHVNIDQDTRIIYGHLKERLDSLPLIVYGVSMGGQIAAKFASDHQEKVAGLVLDGTFTSFTDIAVENSPEEQRQIIRQYVTSPYTAIECVQSIHGIPVLIIHSEEDTKIDFKHSQQIFEVANEPKSFWKYKGEHLDAPILYKDEFIRQITKLVTR